MTGHGREWPIPTIDDTTTDWDETDSTAVNISRLRGDDRGSAGVSRRSDSRMAPAWRRNPKGF